MDKVLLDRVEKQLEKLPYYVVDKLITWVQSVERKGLREVRKIPGYHDEPLKGPRQHQRSIRLNNSYRAIYTEELHGTTNFVVLEEVTKHEY